jgi:hypothetical protein
MIQNVNEHQMMSVGDTPMVTQTSSNKSRYDWIRRYAFGIPVFIGVYLGLVLLFIYPHWPSDLIGWGILVFLGVPLAFLTEWLGGVLFSKKTGKRISSKEFSLKRIGITIILFGFIVSLLWAFWHFLGALILPHFR